MAVGFSNTNKPLNPRGQDASPKGFNRAKLYSGKALDFDGVNDVVNVTTNDLDFGANDFSVSAIVRLDGSIADAKLAYLDKGSTLAAWQIRTNPTSNRLVFQAHVTNTGWTEVNFDNAALEIQTDLTHLTFVRVGSAVTLYINGALYGSGTGLAETLDASNDAFAIGNRIGSSNYWNGLVTQFKVYSTALTAAQVADLYNNPEKVVPTGVDNTALKLWLPMMEGAGTTAINGAPDALGSELVTNGDFDTDSDWTKGTGWSISGGTASCDGSQSDNSILYQNISHSANKLYQIEFTISGYVSGQIDFALDTPFFGATSSNGTFIFGAIPPSGGNFIIRANSTFVGSIDNVSVKEVQNSGVISGATWTHGIGAPVAQTSVIDWNKHTLDGTNEVLIPQGLTSGRDLLGNLFENVRKQGALNLDGNSWAEVHDNASLDLTSAITLEAWVYWDDASNKGILGRWHSDSNNRNYLLYKNSDTTINFYINASAPVSYTSLNATKGWTHIVGTYNRTNAVLYVDGVQQAITAHTTAISTGTLPVEIGRNFTTSNQALTAPIAQPRIYNRALTAEEVARNYDAGRALYQ